MKRLAGQVNQNGRVLTDAVKHDWFLKFRDHFTDDVNAFGFELLEMSKAVVRHFKKTVGAEVSG